MAVKRATEVAAVKALVFDVFGTVVDWRSGIIREGQALGAIKGIKPDWEAFADAWRGMYQPAMSEVREGRRPFTKLDVLHRESLDALIQKFGITGLSEEETDAFNRAWHRLDPWPDSVPGLTRLHVKYPLAPCSNGNVALLMNMARRARLPWDAILGAEPARAFKPTAESYLRTVDMLGLQPPRVMLVAAHADDLKAAAGQGLRTGYVHRPFEQGPKAKPPEDTSGFDVVAKDMVELAELLGC
jgi:2-haloacid dehalogenase